MINDERQKVLVVEDEIVNRKILVKILEQYYDVVYAENGEVAWSILTVRKDIDAVVTDVVMPVMDGYELLKKIARAGITDLPIIVTTSATDAESEQKTLDLGAWDFVPKPYNAKILLTRLSNAISRRQVEAYKKIQEIATHDALTGLYNRNTMFDQTRKMIDSHPETHFAFAKVDINHFALFNLSFGESEGNRLIVHLSKCISSLSRSVDLCTFCRVDADKFALCFEYNNNQKRLEEYVNLIRKEISLFKKDYQIDVAVGIYKIDVPSMSVEEFYFRASTAAKKCKDDFETHYAFYDVVSGEKLANEVLIANEMVNALETKQFVVYLQPKFDLTTETACGAEALVRWKHPVKGMISPGDFIPVFEKNGFISRLDYYVWEETCKMLREWIDLGKNPFPISVNVSRISLYNPKLTENFIELVNRYKLPPSMLQLEITESAYMTNPEFMEMTVESLRAAGFTILMDDFGSGYSSLNTLKRIKVDVLKVDMKFLPVKNETERGDIILASVIKMANWLGLVVIVEGVETRRQRDFVEAAGCDCIQGYYYARPVCKVDYENNYLTRVAEGKQSPMKQLVEGNVPHNNITLLVIDDSVIDQTIVQENFKDLYNIYCCDSAEEGLAYLNKNKGKVKLVLLDNIMPGMTGLDFLKYCKQDNTLNAIPKIMITASNSTQDQVAAFEEGAYDFISKPLNRRTLVARVKHVLEISKRTNLFDVADIAASENIQRDSATGLLNKNAFRNMTNEIIRLYPNEKHAFMVLDIDNFKNVNDVYGHLAGDTIINTLSDILKNAFRNTDFIGRFGGDEFIVLMTRLPNDELSIKKAEEIINTFKTVCLEKNQIAATISIGLSFYRTDDRFETLFAKADQSLYEAKNDGKGVVRVNSRSTINN